VAYPYPEEGRRRILLVLLLRFLNHLLRDFLVLLLQSHHSAGCFAVVPVFVLPLVLVGEVWLSC